MTRSNRTLNRLILVVIGALAIAIGVVLALPAIPEGWLARLGLDRDLLAVGAPTGLALWIVASSALVLVVLALTWVLTRGRGRTRTPLAVDGVELDIRLVEELVRDGLSGTPDLLAVHATAYRRRTPTVRIRLVTRRGADLPRLLAATDRAIESLDRALGAELPILVHLTSGARTALSREHRAA